MPPAHLHQAMFPDVFVRMKSSFQVHSISALQAQHTNSTGATVINIS